LGAADASITPANSSITLTYNGLFSQRHFFDQLVAMLHTLHIDFQAARRKSGASDQQSPDPPRSKAVAPHEDAHMPKMIAYLAMAAALAAPAFAETPDTFNFKFKFDQSELATAQGAARVHHQLRIQTYSACRIGAPSVQRGVDSECREALIEAAVRRINNPMLTQVHSSATNIAAN